MTTALLSALLLTASSSAVYSVKGDQSKLVFDVVHKLHAVTGKSEKSEGKVVFLPNGTVQIMVRAPIASFDSGDGNRDSHMRETLEATKFPFVTFKGISRAKLPDTFPAKVEASVVGELDFHGVKHRETVPVTLEFRSATELRATGKFEISLEKYKVERPSLLFIKIDDECKLQFEYALAAEES